MGKAARWLKGLLSGGGGSRKTSSSSANTAVGGGGKQKSEGRCLARSFREEDMEAAAGNVDGGRGQGKGMMAMAAASTAVARAAVATAQAAIAVVKLAGSSGTSAAGRRMREEPAALKIQAVFRGYLARRALKALRGLVKLQALVRGYLVRKQAAQTFKCMQSLLSAQARARTCRQSLQSPSIPRRDYYPSPQTPQSTTVRANTTHLEKSSISQRTVTRVTDGVAVDSKLLQSPSWKWLDQWMEQRYWDSQGKTTLSTNTDESNIKVVEVDSGRPLLSNARWSYPHHHPPSPSKPSSNRFAPSPMADAYAESCDGSQLFSASSRHGGGNTRRSTYSPTTSEWSGSCLSGYAGHPNYMAYTESAKAKATPLGTPKQRGCRMSSPSSRGSPCRGARPEYYGGSLYGRIGMGVQQ